MGVRRNTIFAFLSQAVRLAANVILFIGLARLYGPEDFGRFTAIHTLATVFILLADFGLDVLTSSEIARARVLSHDPRGELFFVKLLFACIGSISMAALIMFHEQSVDERILGLVFCPFVFFSSILNFFFAVFKGHEQLHHEAWISFFSNAFLLVVVVGLGLLHASMISIAFAFVASRVVGVGLAFWAHRSIGKISPSASIQSVRPLVRSVATYGMHSVLGNLFFVQDTLLLSLWTTNRVVGVYQSAFKVVSLSLIAADVIFYTMLPVLSRLYESDRDAWVAAGKVVHKTLLFASLPIGIVLIVYPGAIIQMLYGSRDYSEAVPLLRVFGFTVVVRYIVDTSATMLTASRQQSRRLVVVAGAVLLNFVLNAFAIPRYGPTGAAIVSLVTNLFVGIGYIAFARNVAAPWFLEIRNVIPVVSAIFLGVLLWLQPSLSFWVGVPISVSLIVMIVYAVGYSPDERARLFTMRGLIRGVV